MLCMLMKSVLIVLYQIARCWLTDLLGISINWMCVLLEYNILLQLLCLAKHFQHHAYVIRDLLLIIMLVYIMMGAYTLISKLLFLFWKYQCLREQVWFVDNCWSQRLSHWQYSNYLYVVFMMESHYPESFFISILEWTVERCVCYTQLLV